MVKSKKAGMGTSQVLLLFLAVIVFLLLLDISLDITGLFHKKTDIVTGCDISIAGYESKCLEKCEEGWDDSIGLISNDNCPLNEDTGEKLKCCVRLKE